MTKPEGNDNNEEFTRIKKTDEENYAYIVETVNRGKYLVWNLKFRKIYTNGGT